MKEDKNEYTLSETVDFFKSLFRYILSKWWKIALVAIVFGVIGVLYAWWQKPLYKSSLTFVADNEAFSGIGSYAGLAAQFGFDIGGGSSNAFEGENLIELLKSRNLVEATLLTPIEPGNNKLLIDHYLEAHKIRDGWKNEKVKDVTFVPGPAQPNRVRDSILFTVYKAVGKGQLQVGKRDKKLDLIEISMSDRDEYFAKRFVEILAENAIAFYTDYKVTKSRQNVKILQRQTDSVRRMLTGGIRDVAVITDLNVNPIRQSARIGAQGRQVDVQTNAALYTELVKNLELAKLSLRKETPLIQIIDSPKFPLEKKKMGRLFGGILFALLGGFFTSLYFTIKFWVRNQTETKPAYVQDVG